MLDKTGNYLEVGDYVCYRNKECIVVQIEDNYVCVNAIDGSLYSSLRDSREVSLIKKNTDALFTYYKYQGCPNISCVMLEALLNIVVTFEDNYQEPVYIEEVQLIVDKKDLTITEQSKIIGYVKDGSFVRVK